MCWLLTESLWHNEPENQSRRAFLANGQFTNKKKIHHEGTKTRRFFESLHLVSWCLCISPNPPEKFQSFFSDGTSAKAKGSEQRGLFLLFDIFVRLAWRDSSIDDGRVTFGTRASVSLEEAFLTRSFQSGSSCANGPFIRFAHWWGWLANQAAREAAR